MKLNKRERRAAQLLAHYVTCERLAEYLARRADATKKGPFKMPAFDGKKISVALWKAEKLAHEYATKYCNGEVTCDQFEAWGQTAMSDVRHALHSDKLPELFVNGDARGHALKIDNETPEGLALIRAVGLHTDMGGYGILSPEIDGN